MKYTIINSDPLNEITLFSSNSTESRCIYGSDLFVFNGLTTDDLLQFYSINLTDFSATERVLSFDSSSSGIFSANDLVNLTVHSRPISYNGSLACVVSTNSTYALLLIDLDTFSAKLMSITDISTTTFDIDDVAGVAAGYLYVIGKVSSSSIYNKVVKINLTSFTNTVLTMSGVSLAGGQSYTMNGSKIVFFGGRYFHPVDNNLENILYTVYVLDTASMVLSDISMSQPEFDYPNPTWKPALADDDSYFYLLDNRLDVGKTYYKIDKATLKIAGTKTVEDEITSGSGTVYGNRILYIDVKDGVAWLVSKYGVETVEKVIQFYDYSCNYNGMVNMMDFEIIPLDSTKIITVYRD